MAWFKEPDFKERQKAAVQAQKTALEKFRAKADAPAAVERQQSRAAGAANRSPAKQIRATEKTERKTRAAEVVMQAARDASIPAEHASAEKAKQELSMQAEQKAARDARYPAPKKARSKKVAP